MADDRTKSFSGRIRFAKMEGAGNDFVVIDASARALDIEPGPLAARVCARRTAVGADGLVLVEGSRREDADVHFRFWNPDGGEIGTCGNGTRCAARLASSNGLVPSEFAIETADGLIRARVAGDRVTLRFTTEPQIELDRAVSVESRTTLGGFVDMGNQHFIVPVEGLPDGPIDPICRPLRFARELAPAGANVSLVEVIDRQRIRIRTYERGVEAETLACGSGSLSSAAVLALAGRVEPPVAVETRSGDVLTVRFAIEEGRSIRDLELEGPARFVYRGELQL